MAIDLSQNAIRLINAYWSKLDKIDQIYFLYAHEWWIRLISADDKRTEKSQEVLDKFEVAFLLFCLGAAFKRAIIIAILSVDYRNLNMKLLSLLYLCFNQY